MRAVGGEIRSRWALGRRLRRGEEAGFRGRRVAYGTVPMASQLAEFKLDVIDGGVDLGAPFFEHLGCGLELDDAVTMEALRFQETMLPLEVALRKTLVEFVGE